MVTRESNAIEQQLLMVRFLGEVDYRSLAANAGSQRVAVSRRLWSEGVDETVLRLLWRYAMEHSQTPIRLFSYWLALPSRTMGKIAEMRARGSWVSTILAQEGERPMREKPATIIPIRKQS